MKHPAVMMATVIGIPDEMRTQIVKAYIVLKPEASPGRALKEQIQRFVRVRLPAHEYPREIAFVKAFPLTATGKIMRRELRQRET
jgi:acetyl-CoA synthetase